MNKCVTKLIPENIAPKGATCGVYNGNGVRVATIPLGRMAQPTGKPLYSFCVLADVHIQYNTAPEDFRRALKYAEENCNFTCVVGDLTTEGTKEQLEVYQGIVQECSKDKPVYAVAGNHENYSTRIVDGIDLTGYTEQPLYYSFTVGNDVFIMIGHYGGYGGDGIGWRSTEFVSADELQWLYETLENNRNKRCFVFNHVLPHEHGVGNPDGLYTSALIWRVADGGIGQAFINLLTHYKNAVLFHGHSHTRLDLQRLDPKANYSEVVLADGRSYKSVHIPSLAMPRDKDPDGYPKPLEDLYAESEGYIVDVYAGYIVLNGRDFGYYDSNTGKYADPHWVTLGTYKIDTTLHTVEAGTFTDTTGIIKT